MATKIFVHGSGHKATSWEKTISYMTNNEDIVCPNLSSILEGKEASYENLYSSFVKYCNEFDGQIHLCGLSLGGILALNFALDFPQKVKTLVLIGTPYKVPKVAFSFQNIIFRFLPKSIFGNVKKCAVANPPKSEKLSSAGQAACCACAHSRYLAGGSPSGLRV